MCGACNGRRLTPRDKLWWIRVLPTQYLIMPVTFLVLESAIIYWFRSNIAIAILSILLLILSGMVWFVMVLVYTLLGAMHCQREQPHDFERNRDGCIWALQCLLLMKWAWKIDLRFGIRGAHSFEMLHSHEATTDQLPLYAK
ncbi:hypothetical protein BCR33DRAFT_713212 [Rhizoclosmatium globosum]|uniref:Uncharacterized protein n=1 Tax=Rhizoclosmatium globosum TaxID=329046 RepID=A0A1Y2CU85_9FUNG|nr:hypothetical protein BCR33DRAFT_713212 [Rhizoclosmatium globosum]|eukprot:ORY50394.1 hypothetical protein BCR33DRAFT_713212 [Rhizoclosmatium globosum]